MDSNRRLDQGPARGSGNEEEHDEEIFNPADAEEIVPDDEDEHMELDDNDEDEGMQEGEEIELQNDSSAYFDLHKDSIFCIAKHPMHSEIVATGGGDDTAYIFDATPPDGPLLPRSYESGPRSDAVPESLKPILKIEGHTDSVNAITFTYPRGEYVVTAGLDGQIRVYRDVSPSMNGREWAFVTSAKEVDEINFLIPCPRPQNPNTFAIGATDGSVWIYAIDASDSATPLTIVQAFYLHTASCTAGAWNATGSLLATVSEDSSLYVWDVFGAFASEGITTQQTVVALTAADGRFEVPGGLFSVAISPSSAFLAVGGDNGIIKIVGLPRLAAEANPSTATVSRAGGTGGKKPSSSNAGNSQAGQILATLQAQSGGIETLSFSSPPLTLLAAGSIDGSIALFDTAHRFAVRRHIKQAHDDFAVVKVEFVEPRTNGDKGWLLTSAGMDGVVRRWDVRGGTAAAGQGFVRDFKGHMGEGEGGGVLDFVQGKGGHSIVTAGDDRVSLIFEA